MQIIIPGAGEPVILDAKSPLEIIRARHSPALTTLQDKSLRVATEKDLPYLVALSRKFAVQVGFLPRLAMAGYVESGNVTITQQNDSEAGYLLGSDYLRWNCQVRPIYQAAVQMDAQRRHHGLALLTLTENAARAAGQNVIQACCREGLEANEFWRLAGFERICDLWPENTRKKHVICWRKRLTAELPPWFYTPPPFAGYRGRRTFVPAIANAPR